MRVETGTPHTELTDLSAGPRVGALRRAAAVARLGAAPRVSRLAHFPHISRTAHGHPRPLPSPWLRSVTPLTLDPPRGSGE